MSKVKVVAVCACPVGDAHTYMVADKFEMVAKKMGYDVKIETQGMSGIETKLTINDLEEADYIIWANDIALRESERFEGFEDKIIKTSMHILLHDTQAFIEDKIK